MTGFQLVTNPAQVQQNIIAFQKELGQNNGVNQLAQTLGHFRAWYAVKDSGVWLFGPSKYVGYVGLTADLYAQNNKYLDGRATEDVLNKWFTVVPPGPSYNALNQDLHAFLARHGKNPSSLARISTLVPAGTPRATAEEQRLADALVVLYRSLPEGARLAFQKLITLAQG